MIVIGIDPHKKTHTAVAAAETGRPLEDVTVPARQKGHERLLEWARGLDVDRVFAIEDCRHVSGSLERFLIERGEKVVRVPPKMMAGVRRSARVAGKSDPIDALAVAQAALRTPDLPVAHLEGPERELRMLLDHREDLVNERTRIESRLRWHLHDIDPTISVPLRSLGAFKWLDKLEGAPGEEGADRPGRDRPRPGRRLLASQQACQPAPEKDRAARCRKPRAITRDPRCRRTNGSEARR